MFLGPINTKNININVNNESYIKATSTEYINNSGGILGFCNGNSGNNYAIIDNCYSNIDVIICGSGGGGITGYADATIIKNSICEARVALETPSSSEDYLSIGGISGYTCNSILINYVEIENCKFNGNMEYVVNDNIDSSVEFSNMGIAGCDRNSASQNVIITNCYFNNTEVNVNSN